MLTYWETLTAIQSNVPVNDSYAQLWGRKSQGGYTVVTYIGTLPATLTGTKAGYLHRYKIYGNTEQTGTPTPDNPIVPSECGEKTENLFDYTTMAVSVIGYYLNATGQEKALSGWRISDYIPCNGKKFTINKIGGTTPAICLYDANKQFLSGKSYQASGVTDKISVTISTATNAEYIRFSYIPYWQSKVSDDLSQIVVTEGSTAPDHYIPYGYKLPLTSAGQDVDIFIGDDTLSAEEYVDSGTGKIYRMVGGVLTPVDPPVPFPQIPTSANSTTISWAGEGLAPSQVELEYEKKR